MPLNARISRVKKDNTLELCVHAGREMLVGLPGEHPGYKPICGGGRDGRSIESWQLVAIKEIDCLRCLNILTRRAKKEGLL